MLTIKQITENTDAVLRGLEKKHFKNAKETIAQVLDFNDKRKANQTILDKNLAEANSLSKSIGQLMKEGKKEEAEAAKSRVAELKEVNKDLQANMDQAANDLQTLLYTIPNVPYDSVPEGVGADDNVVEKIGGMETELPKDALPHWELAGSGRPPDVHRLFYHGPQREQPQPRLRPGAGARRHLHHGSRPCQAGGPQPDHLQPGADAGPYPHRDQRRPDRYHL